jgi:signal transduction histidine kinase
VGAAPVRDPTGRVVAVAMAQSAHIDLTPDNVLVLTLALFGAATVTLVSANIAVTFGLSGLFGYLLARGLTRRLEAVSRAAAAIAAGDLSRRVPVEAQNEVGQLAANFNQMVAHLEETMGEVQRARTQAEEALRARQELVASISHELRTPLAVVQAHLDTLVMRHPLSAAAGSSGSPLGIPRAGRGSPEGTPGEGGDEEEIPVPAATLRALSHEMDRLAALVDDLFALSRAETGAVHVHSAPTDVGALVGEVAALMRPLAQSEGKIALSVEVAPGLPLAMADGDRLRQILANLVRNAVRHTPEGGIIVLSVAVAGPWIVVAVADTGEGIPPEHLQHIFDRFYRVEQSRSRTSGGAGLGLAIVREFVELMGGHVTVESKPGEGSCFRVYLPAQGAS